MGKTLFALLIIASSYNIYSQNDLIEAQSAEPEKVLVFLKQNPEYPVGDKAMFKFIGENLKYPEVAKMNGIGGNVVLRFVIKNDGSIENAKIVRGIGGGCDEEALRIEGVMPRWKPGRKDDKDVNVTYTLPIKFKL